MATCNTTKREKSLSVAPPPFIDAFNGFGKDASDGVRDEVTKEGRARRKSDKASLAYQLPSEHAAGGRRQ